MKELKRNAETEQDGTRCSLILVFISKAEPDLAAERLEAELTDAVPRLASCPGVLSLELRAVWFESPKRVSFPESAFGFKVKSNFGADRGGASALTVNARFEPAFETADEAERLLSLTDGLPPGVRAFGTLCRYGAPPCAWDSDWLGVSADPDGVAAALRLPFGAAKKLKDDAASGRLSAFRKAFDEDGMSLLGALADLAASPPGKSNVKFTV